MKIKQDILGGWVLGVSWMISLLYISTNKIIGVGSLLVFTLITILVSLEGEK